VARRAVKGSERPVAANANGLLVEAGFSKGPVPREGTVWRGRRTGFTEEGDMPDDPKITYSQEDRLLKIKTALGETELLLEKFSGTEALSAPFEFRISMLSTDFSVNLKALLRTNVTVTIYLADGTERYFNAVFRSITHAKEGDDVTAVRDNMGVSNPARDLAVYDAVLAPQVWFLSLDADCKIFQSMSVPDIVGKVLKDHGISDYQFRTHGSYPARDYCVQYRESSLNFISRLLEDEGMFYFFEHTATRHTMVFADKSSLLPPCPNQPAAEYSYDQEGWVGQGEEGVATLERVEQAHTGKVAVTDYSFEKPSLSLLSNLADDHEEVFDYPGKFTEVSEGERYARVRLEEREAQQFVVNGSSRCRAFRPGCNFKLKGHYRADTNQDYFLTAVTHTAVDSTYRQDKDGSHFYANTFKAIPKSIPHRPARQTERPTVRGLQPALVVGKAGEEIWVDKYGRIKVQFYWDRLGRRNEDSSCWCRVSQIWAGKNWGWMSIPRIGQEVLVDFLEGDPDQPVVVGRVYNADQMPPYTLPANQTQSGIKSRSTMEGGSDNYSEISLDDTKGEEMLTIHAEKDMQTTVENDDTQTVQNNRTIEVDGYHKEQIMGDMEIRIQNGHHWLILQSGNQQTDLVNGDQHTYVERGNQSTTVKLGSITTTAMQSITLQVGNSSIKIDQSGVTIQGMMVNIKGNVLAQVEGGAMLTLKGGITMIN
jgi:type VI secretion system secreted protein VgrG